MSGLKIKTVYYWSFGKEKRVKYTAETLHGLNHGEYKKYTTDGKLSELRIFQNGILDKYTIFDKNGNGVCHISYPKSYDIPIGEYINYQKSGEWFVYKDGVVIKKETYKDGVLHGKCTTYFNEPKIKRDVVKSVSTYEDGRLSGMQTVYNSDGSICERYNSKDGKKNGLFEQRKITKVERGRKTEEIVYTCEYKDDVLHGKAITTSILYFSDVTSNHIEEFTYQNGIKHGRYVKSISHNNGKPSIEFEGQYVNGMKDGVFTEYEYGGVICKTTFTKGNATYYTKYNEEGNKMLDSELYKCNDIDNISHKKYIEYYKHGKYIEYYKDGKIFLQTTYKYNGLDGEYVKYYANGCPEIKANYSNGLKIGEYTEYFDNGKLKIRTTFKHNLIDGQLELFGSNGIKLHVFYYCNGKLVNYTEIYKGGKLVTKIIDDEKTDTVELDDNVVIRYSYDDPLSKEMFPLNFKMICKTESTYVSGKLTMVSEKIKEYDIDTYTISETLTKYIKNIKLINESKLVYKDFECTLIAFGSKTVTKYVSQGLDIWVEDGEIIKQNIDEKRVIETYEVETYKLGVKDGLSYVMHSHADKEKIDYLHLFYPGKICTVYKNGEIVKRYSIDKNDIIRTQQTNFKNPVLRCYDSEGTNFCKITFELTNRCYYPYPDSMSDMIGDMILPFATKEVAVTVLQRKEYSYRDIQFKTNYKSNYNACKVGYAKYIGEFEEGIYYDRLSKLDKNVEGLSDFVSILNSADIHPRYRKPYFEENKIYVVKYNIWGDIVDYMQLFGFVHQPRENVGFISVQSFAHVLDMPRLS